MSLVFFLLHKFTYYRVSQKQGNNLLFQSFLDLLSKTDEMVLYIIFYAVLYAFLIFVNLKLNIYLPCHFRSALHVMTTHVVFLA